MPLPNTVEWTILSLTKHYAALTAAKYTVFQSLCSGICELTFKFALKLASIFHVCCFNLPSLPVPPFLSSHPSSFSDPCPRHFRLSIVHFLQSLPLTSPVSHIHAIIVFSVSDVDDSSSGATVHVYARRFSFNGTHHDDVIRCRFAAPTAAAAAAASTRRTKFALSSDLPRSVLQFNSRPPPPPPPPPSLNSLFVGIAQHPSCCITAAGLLQRSVARWEDSVQSELVNCRPPTIPCKFHSSQIDRISRIRCIRQQEA